MKPQINAETTKAIRAWLRANNIKVGCRLGKCFEYEPNEHFIVTAREYDDCVDKMFVNWLCKHGLNNEIVKDASNIIALSVLHEIGHAETVKLFSDAEYMVDAIVKEIKVPNCKTYEQALEMYWNTPTETAANLWAIMYANTFPSKFASLSAILNKTIVWE